jgi:hypothetical protein
MFMILQKWTFDGKFQIFLSTLLKLTTEMRLDYSGTKIIQIFVVKYQQIQWFLITSYLMKSLRFFIKWIKCSNTVLLFVSS